MSNNALMETNGNSEIMERVLMVGDLGQLQPQERVNYYNAVCNSIGLNPLTRPFDYIRLNNKLTLYAKKDATEQLRTIHNVSITSCDVQYNDDLIIVSVVAQNGQGRTDTDLGVVTLGNLKGDAKANAVMKAITKAKRRVTLSICGLGWLDETEIETIPPAAAQPITVTDDGEIIEGETIGDSRAETSPQSQAKRQRPKPPTNGKASDLTPPMPTGAKNDEKDPLGQLKGKAHKLGRKLYKGDWDDRRGEIIADMFSKSSINDLDESELENLIAELADALNRSMA